jgi:hypothetical protein
LHVLEGRTGKVLKRVPLAGGHDSILFADFSGKGYAGDLLVKDRYSSFWVYDRDLKLLWSKRDCNPGHYPMEYDINGDGRDELLCGYTLYSHDGKVLWSHPELGGHCDAVYIDDMDGDGKPEIAIAASEGKTCEQATLLDADGKVLWRKVCDHCQFALIGRFRPDLPGKQVCFVDRQIYRHPPDRQTAEVALYNKSGDKLLGKLLNTGDTWTAAKIDRWTADPNENVVAISGQAYGSPCLLDGHGRRIAVFPFPEGVEKKGAGPGSSDVNDMYAAGSMHHVDCQGDAREEILIYNYKVLYVWTNGAGVSSTSRPAWRSDLHKQTPRLYNNTVYAGRG